MIWAFLYNLIPMLANLSTGVWILAKRPGASMNRWFFAIAFFLALLGTSEILLQLAQSPAQAFVADNVANLPAFWLPVMVLLLLRSFFREVSNDSALSGRLIPLVLAGAAVLETVLTVFTPWVLAGVEPGESGYVIRPGPLFQVVFLWPLIWTLGLHAWFIFKARAARPRVLRLQMMYMGYAPLLSVAVFALIDVVLPSLRGVDDGVSGYPATFFYCLIAGIGTSRTGLMTITPEKAARQALDAQPDGVVLVDRECNVKFSNAAFHRLRGHEPENCPGLPIIKDVVRIRTKGYERLCELPWDELPETLHLQGVIAGTGDDGTPVLITFRKWNDELGDSAGAILVFRDERPVRRLEAQMIQVEKVRGLSTLVSGVAHELNNPLTSILGFSELGQNPLPPEKAQKFFRTIYGEADRAQRVVRSLMEFAGGAAGDAGPVSLNRIAEDVVRVLRYDCERKGITVRTNLAAELPAIAGDASKLRLVIHNLFSNAAEAVEEARRPGAVTVSTFREGRTAGLRVEDTGAGIRAETLPKIFDPFFTTKPVGKGTGLGLSLAQAFVHEMGGTIEVRSEFGKGSVFTVTIPLAYLPAPVQDAVPSSPAPAAGRPSILVIDDDDDIVEMMKAFLEPLGYAVDRAGDGLEGLEKLAARRYDALLVDVKMPRMDGRDFVRVARERDPDLPKRILMCTGDTMSAETRDFIREQGLRSLNKPFFLKDLETALRQMLPAMAPAGKAAAPAAKPAGGENDPPPVRPVSPTADAIVKARGGDVRT